MVNILHKHIYKNNMKHIIILQLQQNFHTHSQYLHTTPKQEKLFFEQQKINP